MEREHEQFDAICADVDDWQPLPETRSAPYDEDEQDEQSAPLDELILAGLVIPV